MSLVFISDIVFTVLQKEYAVIKRDSEIVLIASTMILSAFGSVELVLRRFKVMGVSTMAPPFVKLLLRLLKRLYGIETDTWLHDWYMVIYRSFILL